MDITSLYYFSELAKDLHMTRTANRLFISQQTLSNHILRLEEYYGTQLFYRKPSLSLTNAGEFVLAFANIVITEETNLKDILGDIEQQERGVLRFGASSLRINSGSCAGSSQKSIRALRCASPRQTPPAYCPWYSTVSWISLSCSRPTLLPSSSSMTS